MRSALEGYLNIMEQGVYFSVPPTVIFQAYTGTTRPEGVDNCVCYSFWWVEVITLYSRPN